MTSNYKERLSSQTDINFDNYLQEVHGLLESELNASDYSMKIKKDIIEIHFNTFNKKLFYTLECSIFFQKSALEKGQVRSEVESKYQGIYSFGQNKKTVLKIIDALNRL